MTDHKYRDLLDSLVADPPQQKTLQRFLAEGSQQWLTLYSRWGSIGDGHSGGQYSCLMINEQVAPALTRPSWDMQVGATRPGFVQQGDRSWYERPGTEGLEALVHVRSIPGNRPKQLDISEEFRLLFDLFAKPPSPNLYYLDESGDEVEAVIVTNDVVQARTSLVRRYQAVRRLHLALFFDSTIMREEYLNHIADANWNWHRDGVYLAYYVDNLDGPGDGRFSRLFGKRILPPPAIEQSGMWPYEPERRYEQFIIDVDDVGRHVEHVADPGVLADYFGGNPGAPHYLTPVYFKREVLGKYYHQPERYTIEDGHLWCDGIWGIRIDNDGPDYVVVMLGDLGRDLPHDEQLYWKSFNIPPAGPVSETAIRRGFLGQFADARSFDLKFKRAYPTTNDVWARAFGWPLFRPAHKDDEHLLKQLRIPLTNSQAEFDEQAVLLSKLLVDSINEEAIVGMIGRGEANERGIAKLERFLTQQNIPTPRLITDPLRSIQDIRSSGAAHRKGSRFTKLRASAPTDRRKWMGQLLDEALESLALLHEVALRAGSPTS